MTYTGGDIHEEYPVDPVEDQTGDGAPVTFLHRERDDEVIPPVVPAAVHLNEGIRNFQYGTSLDRDVQRTLVASPRVANTGSLGYVVPLPKTIGIGASEDRLDITTNDDEEIIKRVNYADPEHRDDRVLIVTVDLMRAVDVPDGYSLLMRQPFFLDEDRYAVIPSIVDVDVASIPIECDIAVYERGFKIQYGEPLIQAIPVDRETLKLPAIVTD